MSGTVEEFERGVLTCLRYRYPKWWSETGLYQCCTRVDGEDGLPLIRYIGRNKNLEQAIKNLLEAKMIEEGRRGPPCEADIIYRYIPSEKETKA